MAAVKPVDITCTLRCKVAVCGSSMAGKTSLISFFKSRDFPRQYNMTSGAEVVLAPVQIPDTTVSVELVLLDTSGNDLYKDQVPGYWNGVYYALLVFDISNSDSFSACRGWLELLKTSRPDRDRPLKVVLVATKTDLPLSRHQVRIEAAQDWATQNGLEFFDVSATPPGKDVEAPFLAVAKAYHKLYEDKVQAYQDAMRDV